MDSLASDRPAALRELGALLTGSEARAIASALESGETLSQALKLVGQGRRANIRVALDAAGLSVDKVTLSVVLRVLEGARSDVVKVKPMWTMPGHLGGFGALTNSITELVRSARVSVTCATYNFQKSSGMWQALAEAAKRPEIGLRVYIDATASLPNQIGTPPSAEEVAAHLKPGTVLRSRAFGGREVRSHAKFVAIDHRILVVTSANFSWSAEQANVEFGLKIDDPGLTEAIERELLNVEGQLYETVNTS